MSRCSVELTVASFDKDRSFVTGLFCFDRFPEFTIGPEFLLRAWSVEDQPGLPSSPPVFKWKPKMTFSYTLGCTKLESYGKALNRKAWDIKNWEGIRWGRENRKQGNQG